jgi:hypothetical protein
LNAELLVIWEVSIALALGGIADTLVPFFDILRLLLKHIAERGI